MYRLVLSLAPHMEDPVGKEETDALTETSHKAEQAVGEGEAEAEVEVEATTEAKAVQAGIK